MTTTNEDSLPAFGSRRPRASELPQRRRIYKALDKILIPIRVRHVPEECATYVIDSHTPTMRSDTEPNGVDPTVWANVYTATVELVKHDDALNWQKFYNMIYLHVGLFAAYYTLVSKDRLSALLCPVLGVVFSILFDLTLQEGMRCVRAHKAKVEALDRRLGSEDGFIFLQNPWNHRDALEIGPLVFCFSWVVVAIQTIYLCF
jgi:hypothetical protein